jgi:osmoprotectant transport system permease protein
MLAIAVPLVGFGFEPTFIALLAYGLLPVFESGVSGIQTVAPEVTEAARGTGLSRREILREVELPLAAPVILSGVRVTAAFSIGTATLGSTVGAKGLGEVIVAGLQTSNLAYIVTGGLIVALLAILVDHALATVGRLLPGRAASRAA